MNIVGTRTTHAYTTQNGQHTPNQNRNKPKQPQQK